MKPLPITLQIEELFTLHYRPLCLYAMHFVKDIDLSEDIVQDCFSLVWERLSSGNVQIENMKSYLYSMVRNISLDYLQNEKKIETTVSVAELDEELVQEEVEERSEMEARMWTAIDSLPERCREIFLLNKRDGLKYKEIAEQLGLSVNTVDNQVSKALRLIREGAKKVYTFFFG